MTTKKTTKSVKAPVGKPAKVAKAKPVVAKKPQTVAAKPEKAAPAKKLSAIDAAAKLLAETKEALNCKQLIEAIAAKGYWTSPGGKTPHATLYSAILRELQTKGKAARFVKIERGQFATNPQ